MIVECKNCGAPLDLASAAGAVKCSYCGRVSQVAKMKTLSAVTPLGWQPPPQWTPPPAFRVQAPLVYHGPPVAAAARMGCGVLVLVTVLGILIVGGVAAVVLRSVQRGRSWDGRAPLRCHANDVVRIDGVAANLPQQTAITVEANCDLEIANSTIVAGEGIRAEGNRAVRIRNSTIVAAGTGIIASGNKEIVLVASDVTAARAAIDASGNVSVIVSGGRIEGHPQAIVVEHNAHFALQENARLVDDARPDTAPRRERRRLRQRH